MVILWPSGMGIIQRSASPRKQGNDQYSRGLRAFGWCHQNIDLSPDNLIWLYMADVWTLYLEPHEAGWPGTAAQLAVGPMDKNCPNLPEKFDHDFGCPSSTVALAGAYLVSFESICPKDSKTGLGLSPSRLGTTGELKTWITIFCPSARCDNNVMVRAVQCIIGM